MLYLVKRLWGLVLNIKLILFFLLTLSLGFHVPSDAYAAVDTWTDATTTDVGITGMLGVSMGDASNGVAVGTAGTIVYTTNGGVDWTAANTTGMGTSSSRDNMYGVSMGCAPCNMDCRGKDYSS